MTARKIIISSISAIIVFAVFLGVKTILAAPTCGTGDICSVLTTDGSGNFGIGVNSDSVSRLYIKNQDHSENYNGFKMVSDNGIEQVFVIRNDGLVTMASSSAFPNAGIIFPDGTKQTTAFLEAASEIDAINVKSGVFGYADQTVTSYSFPGSLGVGATTTVGLPANGLYVSGNVGIGTASPHVPLEIYGPSNKLGLTYSYSVVYDGPTGAELYADANGDLHINAKKTTSLVANRNILLSEAGGNIGIGTSTPTYPLTVAGVIHSTTGGYRFPDGTVQTTASSGSGGSGDGWITSSTAVILATSTNSVGIGTSAPASKLDIHTGSNNSVASLGFSESTINNFYFESNFAGTGNTGNWITMKDWNGNNITTWRGDGNFGVGTTDPDYKFSVSGESYFTNSTFPVATIERAHGSQTTDHWAAALIKAKTTGNMADGYGSGIFFAIQDSSGVENLIGAFGADRNGADNSGRLFFDTYSAGSRDTRMVISKDGNVGIGTTAPTSKLDIGSTYSATASAKIFDTNPSIILQRGTATSNTDWRIQNNGADLQFSYGYDATTPNAFASPLLTLTYDGKVGIGNSAPTAKLQIGTNTGTGGGDFYSFNNGGNPRFLFGDDSGAGSYGGLQWNSSADSISLFTSTAGTSQFVLLESGNVGIGTSTPAYPLTVAGVIHSSTGGYRFPDGTTQTTAASGSGGTSYFTLSGNSLYPTSTAYNLGIGTTTPAYPLVVVNSGITSLQVASSTVTIAGGAGKINVGTMDPPYTINGEQYATYMPAMTGQKEETTGEILITCNVQLVTCKAIIDFNSQEKGSDLWLFAKTTNLAKQMDKMTVLLTPSFDGKVWYEKDIKNNVLKIFGVPSEALAKEGYSDLSVSYRLTAPRFDADKWPNTRNEKDVPGLIINY